MHNCCERGRLILVKLYSADVLVCQGSEPVNLSIDPNGMEILSVTLKNFKSHSDRHFTFQPGTNAICGENGAGKTSILEAIAWTLFNYRGAYKNEDLVRNGASSAQAIVAFVSSRDGRTYEVQRCTMKGYTLYDPQLGQRLEHKHIEEEVIPWLRQHLGVAPGVDLGKLFANTIGVPQGTLTADFLQPPEKRKQVFDAILKVEEYKQVNQQMLSLEKYAKVEVESLERSILQYAETLQNWEPLHQKHQELAQEITEDEMALQQLQMLLKELQAERNRLTAQSQQVHQLESQLQTLTTQITGKWQTNQVLEQSVQRAEKARQVCEEHYNSHQIFLLTETTLRTLDQQNKQCQIILKQRDIKQKMLAERQTELTKLMLQLENLANAQQEIEQLQPFLQQQIEIEQQQVQIIEKLQQFHTLKLERDSLIKQLKKFQTDLERLSREVQRVQAFETEIKQIVELEQRRDRFHEQLSRIEAAKQFEADLQQLVEQGQEKWDRHQVQAQEALNILQQMQHAVPLLATTSVDSALIAIQAGVDLNDELLAELQGILADLSEQTSAPKLKQQLQQIKGQLDVAYQQRAEFSMLEARLDQQFQLKGEIEQLQNHLTKLQAQVATEAEWQQRRSQLTAILNELGDPRGRSQLLAREVQQQLRVRSAYNELQKTQAIIQQEIAELDSKLAEFADLENQIEQQQQLRQVHQPGYLNYLQHQKDADSLPTLQTELQIAIAQLQQLEASQAVLQADYENCLQNYNPQQWQQVEATYNETRTQADRIEGSLPQQRKLLDELERQLALLQETAEKRDRARIDLKQKEKVRKFITFARKVYKDAGPRITECYIQSISREADKLFRELLNRPNLALEWNRDYEIIIQEGSHTRRFINLSGGEQMCAALALRLALLRILADIDIAFFDEPTTNMDRPRRESLAEAIANIKTFRQLFVISHDDTFEKVTENVILVERELNLNSQ
jgi:DNA repair protein SbcC/Rad50